MNRSCAIYYAGGVDKGKDFIYIIYAINYFKCANE